ncbi:hypothetical protein EWM64_g6329 [Hericium alpestre]|uniref:Uncharacterized protein n=1 Tax=Hericium alpestre TaxID=135208 RepID=A0A4Y9ZU32_9AGAM|nr:hypothetical protein EWM64_g6329 [Hericium alpestre]
MSPTSDVQSLHNRLQIVESQIAQIVAGGLRGPVSVVASSDNLPFPHNDRAMLATGMSGSSVTISLDDVAALWLEHLDLPSTLPTDGASSSQPPEVKLEPTTAELPPNDEPPLTALLPPLSVYFPSSSQTALVTPQLVALLPSAPTMRSRITCAIEETMRMHPCFNVKHFKSRVENMFAWAKEEDGRMSNGGGSANAKADLARSIFFGMPSSSSTPPAATPPRSPPSRGEPRAAAMPKVIAGCQLHTGGRLYLREC